MAIFGPPISRRSDGDYAIGLRDDHRDMIRHLVPQLRDLINSRDHAAWRLFPNPYPDDPLEALKYDEMVGDELKDKRLVALNTLERTVDASILAEEDFLQWMTAINDIRLVLGTRLDVTEESEWEDFEDDDIEAMLFASYQVLGLILEYIVSAL